MPSGFGRGRLLWPADGDRTADTALQQLTDELDGGDIVAIDVSNSDTLDVMYASTTGGAGC